MGNDQSDAQTASVAELTVDYWKLLKVCERLVAALPDDRRKRTEAQLRFSAGRLESHLRALEIELHSFEGQHFGPELPAVAINGDEFDSVQELIVDSALEPAVILRDKVLSNARVILRESEADVSGN